MEPKCPYIYQEQSSTFLNFTSNHGNQSPTLCWKLSSGYYFVDLFDIDIDKLCDLLFVDGPTYTVCVLFAVSSGSTRVCDWLLCAGCCTCGV